MQGKRNKVSDHFRRINPQGKLLIGNKAQFYGSLAQGFPFFMCFFAISRLRKYFLFLTIVYLK